MYSAESAWFAAIFHNVLIHEVADFPRLASRYLCQGRDIDLDIEVARVADNRA